MKVNHISSSPSIQRQEQNSQTETETRKKQEMNDYTTNEEQTFNRDDIKQAVDSLNGFIEPIYTNIKFIFHEELEKYYVTVVDVSTEEVIREIPPRKMLDMYAAMAESMGLLVDEKI